MRLAFRTAVVLTGVLAALHARAQDAKDDLKTLEGKWKPVAFERGGQALPLKDIPTGTVTFEVTGRVTATLLGHEGEGAFQVDATAKPKTIDLTHATGPDKEKKQFGIYKLEKDKLTVCVSPPGRSEKERPPLFATKDKDHVLFVFERVK
jgi:uncharacterized protein (TIGR03067 family)